MTTSAELFRRQGFAATGLKQIVAEAEAPFGSIYHFFPEGKEQLGEQVIRTSGQFFGNLIDVFYDDADDPVAATEAFFAGAADTLVHTDYADACPIATVALEVSSTSETMRQACAEVFADWVEATARHLQHSGIAPSRARDTATVLVCLLEGAFVLARAQRSIAPLQAAGTAAAGVVRGAVA